MAVIVIVIAPVMVALVNGNEIVDVIDAVDDHDHASLAPPHGSGHDHGHVTSQVLIVRS